MTSGQREATISSCTPTNWMHCLEGSAGAAAWVQAAGTVAAIIFSVIIAIAVPLAMRARDVRRNRLGALHTASDAVRWISRAAYAASGEVSTRFVGVTPVEQLRASDAAMAAILPLALDLGEHINLYLRIRHRVGSAITILGGDSEFFAGLSAISDAASGDLNELASAIRETNPLSQA